MVPFLSFFDSISLEENTNFVHLKSTGGFWTTPSGLSNPEAMPWPMLWLCRLILSEGLRDSISLMAFNI